MAEKTAASLVAYAKAQLGKPYWYGTYGNKPTQSKLDEKIRQYPYPKNPSYSPERIKKFQAQIGKFDRVHDCVGLIKGYLWSDTPTSVPKYNAAQDVSVGGMRSACKTKGAIATLPETPGALVFIGTTHVGVYIGGGQVIEARGSDYGVVQTVLKGRGWDSWGLCPWITYPSAAPAKAPTAATFNIGDKVKIKADAVTYYTGGSNIPDWTKKRSFTVADVGQRHGLPCVLLREIQSSCWIENLQKVQE
jgi:hypothetical protein